MRVKMAHTHYKDTERIKWSYKRPVHSNDSVCYAIYIKTVTVIIPIATIGMERYKVT